MHVLEQAALPIVAGVSLIGLVAGVALFSRNQHRRDTALTILRMVLQSPRAPFLRGRRGRVADGADLAAVAESLTDGDDRDGQGRTSDREGKTTRTGDTAGGAERGGRGKAGSRRGRPGSARRRRRDKQKRGAPSPGPDHGAPAVGGAAEPAGPRRRRRR